jgi:integrase
VEETYEPWSKVHKRSWKSDRRHLEVLKEMFGALPLDQISPIQIERFKRERCESETRSDKPRSPASVNRELEVLSKIFSIAIDHEMISSNPCRKVKKLRQDNRRNRYLSVEEEERLIAVLTGRRAHLLPIVLVALHTGMRRGELLKLEWAQVDFNRAMLHITQANSKTGRPRSIPMNEVVRAELEKLRPKSDGGAVFINRFTGLALTDLNNGFASACRDAEIENFRFHDLRHTFATRLADSGVDTFTIKELLGHASIQTTAIYAHATDAGKRRAVGALSGYSEKNCLKFVTNEKRQAV